MFSLFKLRGPKKQSEENSQHFSDNQSDNSINEAKSEMPDVYSMQEFVWPNCCGDKCQYIGNLADKWHDVSKICDEIDPQIVDAIKRNETFTQIGRPLEELIEATNQNFAGVLIFKCTHCGKYQVVIDLD